MLSDDDSTEVVKVVVAIIVKRYCAERAVTDHSI
jgi:hypothetical protein